MLTYDCRLLRAARASSGEPIVTNANPLFLVLLNIESLTTTKHTNTNPFQNQFSKNKIRKRKPTSEPQHREWKKPQHLRQSRTSRREHECLQGYNSKERSGHTICSSGPPRFPSQFLRFRSPEETRELALERWKRNVKPGFHLFWT